MSAANPNHTYPVAFGRAGEAAFDALRRALCEAEVGHVIGASPRSTARRLHLRDRDVASFLTLVDRALPSEAFTFRRLDGELVEGVDNQLVEGKSFDLLVVERRSAGPDPHRQCACIEIAVWSEVGWVGEGVLLRSDRGHTIVNQLSEETFERLASLGHDFDDEPPSPIHPTFPIDAVYTWVNDKDPEWFAAMRQHRNALGAGMPARVSAAERYRNRNELMYSLRALEQFAPWVGRVHLVTAGHLPSWLELDHPKLNLVTHADIFADSDWLPTFSATAIESQIHHIESLSENFLYFNDDFFLGQTTDAADFFHSNGVLKFFPAGQKVYEGDIGTDSVEYKQADVNAIELLRQDFPVVGREVMQHSPYPSSRVLLQELEDRFARAFAASASSRFRSGVGLRSTSFMQYHYGFQTGRGRTRPALVPIPAAVEAVDSQPARRLGATSAPKELLHQRQRHAARSSR